MLNRADSLIASGDTTGALNAIRSFVRAGSPQDRQADTATAATVDALAKLVVRAGDLDLAEQLYRHGLAQQSSVDDQSTLARARLQNGLGQVLSDLGHFNEAGGLLDSALAARRAVLGERHPDFAATVSATGSLEFNRGDLTQALARYQQALEILQHPGATDLPDVGMVWANMGNVLSALAQHDSAKTAYLRALGIFAAGRPHFDEQFAATSLNLAALYADDERYDDALRCYNQALAVVNETLGSRHPRAAIILSGIATVEFGQGNWKDAEEKFRQALAIYRERGIVSAAVADCEFDLGNLCCRQAQYDSAEVHAQRARALYEETLGAEHPDLTHAHGLLAQIYSARQKWTEARREDEISFHLSRNQFLTHYSSLSEADALRFSEAFREQTSYYLTTLLTSGDMRPDTCRELATILLTSKGLVQDGALARQSLLRRYADDRTKLEMDSLHALRIQTEHLTAHLGLSHATESLRHELISLTAQRERLEKDLAARSPVHREYVDVPVDSVYAAMHRLPPGTFVLDYFVFDLFDREDNSEPHYLVAVFCDTGFVACADLGPANVIERRIRQYRTYLENPRAATAKQIQTVSRSLYQTVWSPIDSYLRDAHMVFLCPDGELNLVSFAGLSVDETSFLIERFPIHYLSTPRDLTRQAHAMPGGRGMILLGDPDYAGALPALPHAGDEVRTVAAAWSSAFAEPLTLLTGSEASERAFRRSFSGARVIYFAAHSAEAVEPHKASQAPEDLLPNGILLSEFRSLSADLPPDSDGLLAAEEILALDLSGTELVVLSTCESGGGRLVRGEGVYGLRRAFQMAGAQTVISTLWPVDDRSTAELMKHGLFNPAASYPEIMQSVCLARIQELRASGEIPNPFLWAAFISAGNWK
jgi:CHAT domain-containing protein/tetratricopeptide (TPR) repeat protein